jgi:hypothetical protein
MLEINSDCFFAQISARTKYENFGSLEIVAGVVTRVWVEKTRNTVWIPDRETGLLYSPKQADQL